MVNDLLRDKGLRLPAGTVVDAILIAAASSSKNASGGRDPQVHESKAGNQWYFGMKAHTGVHAESGLVHTVRTKAGKVNDVVETKNLLHRQETDAFGDAAYHRAWANAVMPRGRQLNWHIAMRPGRLNALDARSPLAAMIDKSQQILAAIRAKVKHPIRLITHSSATPRSATAD